MKLYSFVLLGSLLGYEIERAASQTGQPRSDIQLLNPFYKNPYGSQPTPVKPTRFQTIKRSNPYTPSPIRRTQQQQQPLLIQQPTQPQQFQRRPQYPVSRYPPTQQANQQQQTTYPSQQPANRAQYRPWNPVPWNYTYANPNYQSSNPVNSPAQYRPQPQTYAPTNTPSRASQLKYLFGSGSSQPAQTPTSYPQRTVPSAQWGIPASYPNTPTQQSTQPTTGNPTVSNPYQINPLNPYTETSWQNPSPYYPSQPTIQNPQSPGMYYDYSESDMRTIDNYWTHPNPGMAYVDPNRQMQPSQWTNNHWSHTQPMTYADPTRNQVQDPSVPIPRLPTYQYPQNQPAWGSPSTTPYDPYQQMQWNSIGSLTPQQPASNSWTAG